MGVRKNMINNIFRKSLVIGLIFILLGVNIFLSIGSISKINKTTINNFEFLGNWFYVGGSGPNNYTSIQSAIENASDGDIVYVYDDSSPYNENLEILGKSIDLIGENKDTTIINWNNTDNLIYVEHGKINICGFTLQSTKRIMYISISNNNIVTDNIIRGSDGIFLRISNNNIISNNFFNSINSGGCGIGLCDSSYNAITNNVLINFSIFFDLANWDNPIFQNTISNNLVNDKPFIYYEEESDKVIEEAGQVILIKCDNITVQNQEFSNLGYAIQLIETNNCLISNNTVSHCSNAIDLNYQSSYNYISGNSISDYHIGIFINNNCIENNICYNSLINSDGKGGGIKIFQQSNSNHIYMNTLDNSEVDRNGGAFDIYYTGNCNFSMNTIINFFVAFEVTGDSDNNIFYNNDIIDCTVGIWFGEEETLIQSLKQEGPKQNSVINNNFKRVISMAISTFFIPKKQIWDGNFWGRSRIFPKIIIGLKFFGRIYIPGWVEFDMHPAKKPNDIFKIAI